MFRRVFCCALMWGMAIGISVCGGTSECSAAGLTVAAGYDLFQTEPGTSFMGVDFTGVPLVSYNFGGTVGIQLTGPTDTIIQRPSNVTVGAVGDSGTTKLMVDALQLMSTTKTNVFDPALAANFYYITLHSPNAGDQNTGTMTITFNSTGGGTFTSSLDVNFDIHYGSITGAVVATTELTLTNSGASWGRIPAPGTVLINGANNLLDGTDHNQDFFVSPPLIEKEPGAGQHVVIEAGTSIPEPTSWIMLGIAGLIVPAYVRWARRRA
jgi:hypothetical protein